MEVFLSTRNQISEELIVTMKSLCPRTNLFYHFLLSMHMAQQVVGNSIVKECDVTTKEYLCLHSKAHIGSTLKRDECYMSLISISHQPNPVTSRNCRVIPKPLSYLCSCFINKSAPCLGIQRLLGHFEMRLLIPLGSLGNDSDPSRYTNIAYLFESHSCVQRLEPP